MASVLDSPRASRVQGRARRAVLLAAAFGAWTLLVWAGRIRNVLVDDDLSGPGRAWRLLLALLFVVGALDVLVRVWQAQPLRVRRGAGGALRLDVPRRLLRSVALLAVLTTLVWLVRGTAILVGDHPGGFKLVHALLAVSSIALAVAAWQAVAPRSPGAAAGR